MMYKASLSKPQQWTHPKMGPRTISTPIRVVDSWLSSYITERVFEGQSKAGEPMTRQYSDVFTIMDHQPPKYSLAEATSEMIKLDGVGSSIGTY
ncbi:hypothetical protein TNCT_299271 [Trichonephila clavata]|uniref:Uncharacterized protein n=1 Tax=Trichonephila clavata TaxID=2740835 RepID=A0A8X6KAY6_TRICU|nr:hypothetical protein TNCT_299271 [Trichonephila clavata]